MAIDVRKIEIKSVSDASGLDEWIASGDVAADEIIAVIGKTEGGDSTDFDCSKCSSCVQHVGHCMNIGNKDEPGERHLSLGEWFCAECE